MARVSPQKSIIWLAILSAGAGCGAGGTGTPNPDGGTVGSVRDIAFIRQSRGLLTTEPEGLRNLEVLVNVGGTPTRRAVTSFTSINDSVCNVYCLLTPDRSRLLAVVGQFPNSRLLSMPVNDFRPDFANAVPINEDGKPIALGLFRLIPPGNRVLFIQRETEETAGGPETYTLASASVTGGGIVKYRNGPFPPSSPFNVSEDGSRILFGEILGAASQLNIYTFVPGDPGSSQLAYRLTQEGSAQFGSELLELAPNGQDIVVATQIEGQKVLLKVTADGRTTTPRQLRYGPRECGAAGANDICDIQSRLYFSRDGRTLYFLGGRQTGTTLVSQLYAVSAELTTPPQALSAFTTEIQSLVINRARDRVVWSTEAESLKRNYALFALDFNGTTLSGTPEKIVDDSGLSFHFQEPYFLE